MPNPRFHKHRWSVMSCACPDPSADGFGPQSAMIHQVANAADVLTGEQVQQLRALRDEAFWADWLKSWHEATSAAATAIVYLNRTEHAPSRSIWMVDTLFDSRRHGYPRPAGSEVGYALAARDLIGDVFTQAHYDFLTMPWRTAVGKVHADDPDRNGSTSELLDRSV